MKQSPNDNKRYLAKTLTNGLRVLFIENAQTNKAAAALAVNAGHFNDPKDREGLAHFVEHMLFLGTEKYPDGSSYQKFISQHGGHNNAWTATEHTCFFFDIQQNHFAEALDRFSEFFISPLLSESFIQSERQNIDAEFKLKLKDDIRRLYDVHKETINQAHPFSQFSVGNVDTLADRKGKNVQQDVANFFNSYYRAENMTLAIESPMSLQEMQSLVEPLFSRIRQADRPLPSIKVPLYLPENLGVKINVLPVKNDRQLIVSFALPSIDKYYRHKPESIIAYLLGHEGVGSILSTLKRKQWAMGLTAGSGVNGENFKDFNISVSLTELGESHIDDVLAVIFSYINLLKKSPIAEYYYEEKQALAELSFKYQEKMRPLDSVSQFVINMQHYPAEDYTYGDYMMEGMCHESIAELLSFISPYNCRVIHISKQHQTDKKSKWYKVPYNVEQIEESTLIKWEGLKNNFGLSLPPQNPYIVADPVILPHDKVTSRPELIEKHDGLAIWFKQDTTFKVPKGYIYIGIDSPLALENTKNIAMTRLFADLYSDAIIEEHYDAELAGIHYHLYSHQGGVTLQVSGISEKQKELLDKLLYRLQKPLFEKERFDLLKNQLTNHWNNANKSKSISQLFSALSTLMQPNNPSNAELKKAIETVSFEEFLSFSKSLFSKVTLDILVHGNWLHEHAEAISNEIKKTFKDKYKEQYKVHCPVIDIKSEPELLVPISMPDHDNATVIYYPQESKDINTTAISMLTSHILAPIFFQKMRTEKQFGYLVNVGYIPINRYPGIAFYIQSPHIEPQDLVEEINLFIEQSTDELRNMPTEQWKVFKQGLAGQLTEKDTSLRIKSQRFWSAICNEDENFNHKERLIDAMLNIEITAILNFIEQNLKQNDNNQYSNKITMTTSKSSPIEVQHNESNKNNDYLPKIVTKLSIFAKNALRKY